MTNSEKSAFSAQPDEATLNFMRDHQHMFFEATSRKTANSIDLTVHFKWALDEDEKRGFAQDLSALVTWKGLTSLSPIAGVFGDSGAFNEASGKGEYSKLIANFPLDQEEAVHKLAGSLNDASREIYLERNPAKATAMAQFRNIFARPSTEPYGKSLA